MFEVAIAFVVFNRPEITQRTLERIACIKPRKLYVIADGPRPNVPSDVEKCRATREIIDRIDWDWDFEIHKNFSDTNLGCGLRPSSGFSWVFEHEEYAIILEDDCLPTLSFFKYCEEMLVRYRDNERVMNISGTTVLDHPVHTKYSYRFSQYPAIWGWATWRRAWARFDLEVKNWENLRNSDWIEHKLHPAFLAKYFRAAFDLALEKKGMTNIWDYQWNFAIWSHDGICIFPRENLVSNIGWGPDGTHTLNSNDTLANKPTSDLSFPLKHPPEISVDQKLDKSYIQEVYRPRLVKKKKSIYRRIVSKVSRLVSR